MSEKIRSFVLFSDAINSIESLESILPSPWRVAHETTIGGNSGAVCEAPVGTPSTKEELERELREALSDAKANHKLR